MPRAKDITDEDMSNAGLSDEERAAFEDDEETGVEGAAAQTEKESDGGTAETQGAADPDVPPQASGEDKPDGGAADPSESADAPSESADAPPEETPGEGESGDDTPPDMAAEPPADDNLVDSFRSQLAAHGIPEDLPDQIKANSDAIEALDKQLEDGEIDYAAHAKQNRELIQQMTDLRALQRESEFVEGNNELTAQQHWQWEVERFTEENEQFKNPVINGALRGALDELYKVEENAGKPYRWFLKTAAESVNEAFNISQPVVTDTPDEDAEITPAPADIEKAVADAAPVTAPPKTLAGVPEAAASTTTKDPFAALDDMDGMALEESLSKMSKSDQQRYLDTRNY